MDPYDNQFALSLTWIVHADGEPVAADDIDEFAWSSADELPDEMAFSSQKAVLALWAARARGSR